MPAQVITITSGKGGVGKTTAVANLAVALAADGAKVVCIDGDIGLRIAPLIQAPRQQIALEGREQRLAIGKLGRWRCRRLSARPSLRCEWIGLSDQAGELSQGIAFRPAMRVATATIVIGSCAPTPNNSVWM